jgi:hypothetical protein
MQSRNQLQHAQYECVCDNSVLCSLESFSSRCNLVSFQFIHSLVCCLLYHHLGRSVVPEQVLPAGSTNKFNSITDKFCTSKEVRS